jgi:hypothetical protein
MAMALAASDQTGSDPGNIVRELVRVVGELHDVAGEPWPDRPSVA